MKIENTELEYSECDAIALDYFLSDKVENMHEWAQRVWNLCIEYKETNGKGFDPTKYSNHGMPRVYRNDSTALWKNKIKCRRNKLACIIFGETDPFYNPDDTRILECRESPKYKTRNERDAQEKAEDLENERKMIINRKEKVRILREEGLSDNVIGILAPTLKFSLGET